MAGVERPPWRRREARRTFGTRRADALRKGEIMKRVRIAKPTAKRRTRATELDLRSPAGRRLPY
ncbi:hypothetical protein GCM10009850_120260 [Nonomuraea monospora]|uniref:Uncharacterized protein n=1 Tax=Nonomuraea monospora TaxID=568818 RepID=A0ABP5PY20_9ACTN